MNNKKLLVPIGCLVAAACVSLVTGASTRSDDTARKKEWESWNAPFKPFRIIGNIHYVGPAGISSFLVTTPEGHILVDTGFEMTVPRVRESVAKLGFKLEDIKIILSSHAHLDHVGGHALMKKLTGAQIMMSEADAALLASGGTDDFMPYSRDAIGYPPAIADRLLRDGDEVTLGSATLTCHLTPGHTKGCTTWTMDVTEDGKVYHVVFFGSTSILPGVSLVNNPKYPSIVHDLTDTYRKLKALPCDVFLAPHAGFFGLGEKAGRLERGERPNPFIDPAAYREFIAKAERAFRERVEQERKELRLRQRGERDWASTRFRGFGPTPRRVGHLVPARDSAVARYVPLVHGQCRLAGAATAVESQHDAGRLAHHHRSARLRCGHRTGCGAQPRRRVACALVRSGCRIAGGCVQCPAPDRDDLRACPRTAILHRLVPGWRVSAGDEDDRDLVRAHGEGTCHAPRARDRYPRRCAHDRQGNALSAARVRGSLLSIRSC